MDWRCDQLSERERYRLLVNTVLPRPIALVTTCNGLGRVNTAPFSFFNVMGSEPPVVALGLEHDPHSPDGLKDTTRNILAGGQFVVNLISASMARAMNICGIPYPPDQAEHPDAGLDLAPSRQVRPPRIAQSPVQFECRLHTALDLGPLRHIVIGEIVHLHCSDRILTPEGRIDMDAYDPIGRLHGSDWYLGLQGRFQSEKYTQYPGPGAHDTAGTP